MKKYALCCIAVLLPLASPLSATITKYQSAAIWNQTNTLTCQVPFGGNTQLTDLIVVWTTWQTTSGTPNTITASVTDTQGNGFPSAVGPTVQPTATNPTAAQIFYAKNLQNAAADTVKVTYNSTAASASCVIVEHRCSPRFELGGGERLCPGSGREDINFLGADSWQTCGNQIGKCEIQTSAKA